MKNPIIVLSSASFLWLASAAVMPSAAGGIAPAVQDHLECYKLAYSKKTENTWTGNAHAKDALTLSPLATPIFAVEQGCVLLPKKNPRPSEVCTPVDKQPRQLPDGAELTSNYLCYAMKCPAGQDVPVVINDQFGSGNPIVKRKPTTRRFCVPSPVAIPG